MSPRHRALLAALPAILIFSGCYATRLKNLPLGVSTDCPKAWPGAWIALDDSTLEADESFGLLVDVKCQVTALERDNDPRDFALRPQFLGAEVVLLSSSDAVALSETDPTEGDPTDASWFPLRWERGGEVLALSTPDARRAATLVVQGAWPGDVSWAFDGGDVLLKSAAEELPKMLADDDFWARQTFRFRRVGDDRRALDKALRAAERAEERKAKDAAKEP